MVHLELHDIRMVHLELWYSNGSFGTLVLAVHCYCGSKIQNMDFFRINCFKESKNMAVEKNP